MDPHQHSTVAALERLSALVGRDEELVGEEPLERLLECARVAAAATTARMDPSNRRRPSSPVERCSDGSVKVTSPHDSTGRYPVLVLEGCPPGEFSTIQCEVLLLCGAMIGSVVRASDRRTQQGRSEARRDAVHAVVMAAVQHIDLDEMLVAAVEALRRGVRCQGVLIRAFDSPDPASLRHAASFPSWAIDLATESLLDVSGRAARICWDRQCASSMSLDEPDIVPLTNAAERDFMFDFMRSIQARSLLMAPMGGAGECQGFIALTRTTLDEPFDTEDEAAAMTIGRELGNAVVQSRLFASQQLLVDELKDLHDYKDNFVATVAHQLKNPLTSIMLHVELLELASTSSPAIDPGEARSSLPVIQRGAERIRETVDALLTLSKVQLANHPLVAGGVGLSRLVRDCVQLIGAGAGERGVTIGLEHLREDSMAWGDRGEIEMVVDNLLSNAVKFSRPGSTVTVATYEDEGGVVLECRDQGVGIGAADLERLFEPFFRSRDPAALAEPGTGLGMAIVKAVIDRHQGRIDVASEPGTGTTFRVWLPSPPREPGLA